LTISKIVAIFLWTEGRLGKGGLAVLRVVIRVEHFGRLALVRIFLPTDEKGYVHPFLVSRKEKLLGEELTEIWGIQAIECYKGYRTKAIFVEGSYKKVRKFVETLEKKLSEIAKENGEELRVDIHIYFQSIFSKITL